MSICRRATKFATALAVVASSLALPCLPTAPSVAEAAEPGSGSEVTIKARDYDLDKAHSPFPDLEVTVSQTKDLLAQGIRISYRGGPKGDTGGVPGLGGIFNFVQVAQCWGDDPDNPGHPDRRTCVFGGTGADGLFASRYGSGGLPTKPTFHPKDRAYTVKTNSDLNTEIPFVAWNEGRVVDEAKAPQDRVVRNILPDAKGDPVALPSTDPRYRNPVTNEFYSRGSTNEVNWAPFAADGTGSLPFELQTAAESSSLNCGAPGASRSCWLVVIPRGHRDSGMNVVSGTPLRWDSWQHHIAFKLDFKPVGQRCDIKDTRPGRYVTGTELASPAFYSWNPILCTTQGLPPVTKNESPTGLALSAAAGTAPSPLAIASRSMEAPAGGDPLAYAPIGLAGVTISVKVDFMSSSPPAQLAGRLGTALPPMKLTPRLLAKLLTASYVKATVGKPAMKTHLGPVEQLTECPKGPRWCDLVYDPEFLEINKDEPAWAAQDHSYSIEDVQMPIQPSDMTYQVWQYILADNDARAWLDGEPDPWGMTVNPYYSTNAAKVPKKRDGSAGEPNPVPANVYYKSDATVVPEVKNPVTKVVELGAIDLLTQRPFSESYTRGAFNVLRGDRQFYGNWNMESVPHKYVADSRDPLGRQHVAAFSTSPAAELYQTATVLLRNPAGNFVGATQQGLTEAAAAMTPGKDQPQVVSFDPASEQAKKASGAYPLAMPIYAALNPEQSDAALRADYATMITYAATHGQVRGDDDGKLPMGYAPIPKAWAEQALKAAQVIKDGKWPDPPAPPEQEATPPPAPDPPTEQDPVSSESHDEPAVDDPEPPAEDDPSEEPAPATDGEPVDHAQPDPEAEPPAPKSGVTPGDPAANPLGAIVPATGLLGLLAAAGYPLIARRRRHG